jgi:acetyltransferase-like isoleucine patch superfamily enzyme
MRRLSKLYKETRNLGVFGLGKSAYYSKKFTDSFSSILLHSKVITELSPDTTFNINGYFAVGRHNKNATHPRIGRSNFSTADGSTVSHTGVNMASIGPCSIVHIEGTFSMGDSYINSHSRVLCGEAITIGDDVAIAWNVEFLDDDRHHLLIDGERQSPTDPIEIKDHVWIGHSVSIHKGVTVHKNSVVASDSVVVSDVPPNTLVAGCPAEVVKTNVDWE